MESRTENVAGGTGDFTSDGIEKERDMKCYYYVCMILCT